MIPQITLSAREAHFKIGAEAMNQLFENYRPEHQPRAIERVLPTARTSGGLIGGAVWRVMTDAGVMALKQWPLPYPPRRAMLIHQIMRRARDAGLDVVPIPIATKQGTTLVRHAGAWFDLCEWRPGQPPIDVLSTRQLRSGLATLAAWSRRLTATHLSEPLSALEDDVGEAAFRRLQRIPCPGMQRRQNEWRRLLPTLRQRAGDNPFDLSRRTEIAVHRLRHRMDEWLSSTPLIVPRLCLRDPHREHLLYSGDEVSGLIDFAAIGFDSPMIDVARWAGDVCLDNPEQWKIVLDEVPELFGASKEEVRSIRIYDITGLVIAVLHWRHWLGCRTRWAPDETAVTRRWLSVIDRLERPELAASLLDLPDRL